MMKAKTRVRAFSLVELVIVVVIIGVMDITGSLPCAADESLVLPVLLPPPVYE